MLDFAGRSVGAIESHTDISLPGSKHRVSVLTTRTGDRLVAKWFHDSPSYFHSFDALSHHTGPLGNGAPRLIDHHDGLKAILMTLLPGAVASADEARDPVIHFRVGQLMREFHESAPATRSVERGKDLAAELSGLIDQTEGDLGDIATADLRALGMQILDIGPLRLQPLHGALRPEHWLIDENYGTQLISFSASEYDPWIVDTAYLERDYWGYSPELRAAFFAGYDQTPTEEDLITLRVHSAISALRAWVQAKGHSGSKKTRALLWSRVEQALGATLF